MRENACVSVLAGAMVEEQPALAFRLGRVNAISYPLFTPFVHAVLGYFELGRLAVRIAAFVALAA